VHDRAELFARQIKAAGYDVVGDLTELIPDEMPEPEPEPTRAKCWPPRSPHCDLAGRLPANPEPRTEPRNGQTRAAHVHRTTPAGDGVCGSFIGRARHPGPES